MFNTKSVVCLSLSFIHLTCTVFLLFALSLSLYLYPIVQYVLPLNIYSRSYSFYSSTFFIFLLLFISVVPSLSVLFCNSPCPPPPPPYFQIMPLRNRKYLTSRRQIPKSHPSSLHISVSLSLASSKENLIISVRPYISQEEEEEDKCRDWTDICVVLLAMFCNLKSALVKTVVSELLEVENTVK
jgi:hypothetical protein